MIPVDETPSDDPARPDPTAPSGRPAEPQPASPAEVRQQAARRKALDALFGEVLPDVTADETGRGDDGGRADRWYSENRPPHHG